MASDKISIWEQRIAAAASSNTPVPVPSPSPPPPPSMSLPTPSRATTRVLRQPRPLHALRRRSKSPRRSSTTSRLSSATRAGRPQSGGRRRPSPTRSCLRSCSTDSRKVLRQVTFPPPMFRPLPTPAPPRRSFRRLRFHSPSLVHHRGGITRRGRQVVGASRRSLDVWPDHLGVGSPRGGRELLRGAWRSTTLLRHRLHLLPGQVWPYFKTFGNSRRSRQKSASRR